MLKLMHNVLLDFLRIKRHFKEDELRTLYIRLGEWYLAENDFPTSYGYFNSAGDTERILSHLNEPGNIRNELTGFEGSSEMFRKVPRELLYQYPLAYLQHILLSIVRGDDKKIAEYALETGDLAAAELNSFRAIYKAKTKEQTSIIICANFTLIRLYLLQRKITEAIDMLKHLEQDVAAAGNPIYNTTVDMCKGYIYACLGQREKIPLWLQTGDMKTADLLYKGVAFNYVVYGKAILLSKNYIALEVLTETFQEQFSLFSNQLGFLHNHIFKAIAKYHLNGMKEGVVALEHALSEAQADDIILPFA